MELFVNENATFKNKNIFFSSHKRFFYVSIELFPVTDKTVCKQKYSFSSQKKSSFCKYDTFFTEKRVFKLVWNFLWLKIKILLAKTFFNLGRDLVKLAENVLDKPFQSKTFTLWRSFLTERGTCLLKMKLFQKEDFFNSKYPF